MLNITQPLDLISESSTITVNFTLLDSSVIYTHLYIDQYYYDSDEELPKTFENHIIGYIANETPQTPSPKQEFFNTLQLNNLIYRALDGESAHFYYIFYQTQDSQIKIPLIKFPFSSLYPDFSYLFSLSFTYSTEVVHQYNCTVWVELYKKTLAHWINFSSCQKTKILSLKQDIQSTICENKVPRKNLKSFGDCLLCYERSRNLVFLPCGHIVSCLQCAVCKLKVEITDETPKTTVFPLCPICKQPIKNAIEIFI